MEFSTFKKSPGHYDPPMHCQGPGALKLMNNTDGGKFIESVTMVLFHIRSAKSFFQRTTLYDTLK